MNNRIDIMLWEHNIFFLIAIYTILSFVLTIQKDGSIFYGMYDKINEKIDVISRGGI